MVGIRQYKASELDNCRALWAEMTQQHREIYNDPTIGGENPGLEFDGHLKQVGPEHVWLATDENNIVGLVSLIPRGEEAEIEPVVVSRDFRGRGIGQKLVNYAIEQAKQAGVICLSVKPVARNEEAIRFFHESGFRTLGHLQLFMWLGPATPGQWKPGPKVFGKAFDV